MKITIESDSHWHEFRAKHIGGSEVAALFGRSPYTTPWQLWQVKAGRLDMPFDETFTRAGKFFEAGIAEWAAEKWGMKIHKVREYYTDEDCPGSGATLDYADEEGRPVEIKFNHFAREDWQIDGDMLTEVPESYVFQCQHQMACYGGDYAWLVAFVRGEPRRMKVVRSEKIIAAIRAKVADFWQSIAGDRPPPVDFSEDGGALTHMLLENGVRDVDLSDMEDAFADYMRAVEQRKAYEKQADTLKTIILERAEQEMRGVNEPVKKATVRAGRYKMTLTNVEANPGKMVTPEMVGTRVGGKKGYLMARFGEKGDE